MFSDSSNYYRISAQARCILSGRSMPVVRTLRVRVDRVQFPAARQSTSPIRIMDYKFWKRIIGVLLMILGALALITPLTPGAWLIFVGAEMLGIGILSRQNVALYYEKAKIRFGEWVKGKEKE